MKNYLNYLIGACTSLDTYRKLQFFSVKRVIIYYLIFLAILSSLYTAIVGFSGYPQKKAQASALLNDAVQYFPEKAVITWNGSELTSNQPIVTHAYPELVSSVIPIETLPDDFFALSATTAAFVKIDNSVLTFSSKEQVLADVPLGDIMNSDSFTLTKSNAGSVFKEVLHLNSSGITALLIVSAVFFALLLFGTRIAALALEVVFFYILQRFLWGGMSFKRLLKYIVTVSVPAELITTIVSISLPHSTVPIYALTLWIYLAIVLLTVASRQSE